MSPRQRNAHPCERLKTWGQVAAAVRRGIRAVATRHRALIGRAGSYLCSLDLDAALQDAEPNAARWDYILADREGDSAGIEVHPAKASEVGSVIEKKRWAEEALLRECGLKVTHWHWVRPPGSHLQFTPLSPAARRLARAGVQFPVARVP